MRRGSWTSKTRDGGWESGSWGWGREREAPTPGGGVLATPWTHWSEDPQDPVERQFRTWISGPERRRGCRAGGGRAWWGAGREEEKQGEDRRENGQGC